MTHLPPSPIELAPGVDSRPFPTGRAGAVLGTVLALVSAACSSRESEGVFAAAQAGTGKEEVRLGASSAERFRFQGMPSANQPAGAAQPWHWTTPPGWTELPTTSLRLANFRVAGDERAECYLTSLAGEGGGLAGNVNRWRSQMSQAPLSAEEISLLPRVPWLGRQAVLLEIDGTWSGMSGSESGQDYRLVGLLLVDPAESRFLKMTGPREIVARETPAFRALADSFHAGGPGHDHGPAASAGSGASTTAAPAPAEAARGTSVAGSDPRGTDPHAGLDPHATGATPPANAPLPTSSANLSWNVPEGWIAGAQKSMREVTFLGGENLSVECYVALLSGDGGGLRANLDRWRQQFGREPLSDAELADLQRVPMLGAEARVIEVTRAEEGPNDMVLGAVCLLPDRSVFVKMTGPRAQVTRQREAFLEFCRSLRPVR